MNVTRPFATAMAAFVLPLGLCAAANAARPTDEAPCTARLIAAHEGYRAHTDGDTVASQKAAFAIGANIGDSDVWRTQDGYLVERHDNDLSTSTDGTGLITNSTWAYVHSLHTTQHHELVPLVNWSLKLAVAREPDRYIQFETKWSMNGWTALEQLARAIENYDMADHTIIYSSYRAQLKKLESIDPAIITIFKAVRPPSMGKVAGLDGTMLKNRYLNPMIVQAYHSAGYLVIRHLMADTPHTWEHFVLSNADGLMTDQPKLLVEWCKQL